MAGDIDAEHHNRRPKGGSAILNLQGCIIVKIENNNTQAN